MPLLKLFILTFISAVFMDKCFRCLARLLQIKNCIFISQNLHNLYITALQDVFHTKTKTEVYCVAFILEHIITVYCDLGIDTHQILTVWFSYLKTKELTNTCMSFIFIRLAKEEEEEEEFHRSYHTAM